MAANTSPIFSRVGDIQGVTDVTAANNTADLTSGTSYLVFTADATEGGWVEEVRVKAQPGANTAATVVRIWINNGATLATADNTLFIAELSIPATTASASSPTPDFSYPLRRALSPGHRIYATVGTAPGGSGRFTITAFGGKY
jgi:hypothetical protein